MANFKKKQPVAKNAEKESKAYQSGTMGDASRSRIDSIVNRPERMVGSREMDILSGVGDDYGADDDQP